MRRLLSIIATLAALSAGALSAGEGDVMKVGDIAPLIKGTATDGSTIDLAEFKDKVVLVGFFAMWCGGCVAEMPRLESEVYQPYKGAGLQVIEVGRGHHYTDLAAFKRNHGFHFTIVGDPQRAIYNKFATDYIPRCYVIGKDGRIKFTSTGMNEGDFAEMKRRIVQELAVPIEKIAGKVEKAATPTSNSELLDGK